jgi:hypothetical protein
MTSTFSTVFVGLNNINIIAPYTPLKVVMKYLIKLWNCDNLDLISTLKWESENVDDLVQEVSKSLPKGIRATIEEENVERESKTTR